MTEIFTRFPEPVQENPSLQRNGLAALVPLLSNDRQGVRKRATITLSALAAFASSDIFTQLCTVISADLSKGDVEKSKTMTQLVGSLARISPKRLGRRLPEFMPKILSTASQDDDELREAALQTMESILLRCPSEVTPFLNQIIEAASTLLKHDPNYAGAEDDDEDMEVDGDNDDEEDDDIGIEDDYSDDDDVSWKVRRAAARTLNAAITTRSELLSMFLTEVAPTLVSRFSEREETVKVEVLQGFLSLLRQVQGSIGIAQATEVRGQSPGALKRKRGSMEPEEGATPLMQLKALKSSIATALLKELPTKSSQTRLLATVAFKELTVALHGDMDQQIPAIVTQLDKSLRTAESSTAAGSSLKAEILSFLRVICISYSPRAYEAQLPVLGKILIEAIEAKAQRDAIEALATASDLVAALYRKDTSGESAYKNLVEDLYSAIVARLQRADSDQEMKAKAIAALGILLSRGGSALSGKLDECLPLLSDRLRNEVTRFAVVKVVGLVAASTACSGPAVDGFLQSSVPEVSSLVRQSNRALKLAAFETLEQLIRRLGNQLPASTAQVIVQEVEPLIAVDGDLNLLPPALTLIDLTITAKPESVPAATDAILPVLQSLVKSPFLQGPALEAVVTFIRTLVTVDSKRGSEVMTILTSTLDMTAGSHAYASVARCIGAVARADPSNVDAILVNAAKNLKTSASGQEAVTAFNLLILGEVGRIQDLSSQSELLGKVYEHLKSPAEEVKSAAAFALGNAAVGSPTTFLPVIRQQIDSKDVKQSLLALTALKELIAHGSTEQLISIAEQVWEPLFNICQTKDEATRTTGAECLARLTLTDPSRYLHQLQSRLHDPSASTRAAVIAAVRFTLTDVSTSYQELLAPLIIDFFSLLQDKDLDVRRHAMFAFNSAAHNKPSLIRDHLNILLPMLYQETHVRKELQRTVTMGPFTVTQDDGLDLRKNAYETMYTLLDTCLGQIHLSEYLSRVLAGMKDDDQVKLLCYLTIVRLCDLAPLQVSRTLDDISEPIGETLKVKQKDGATKQDVEKATELTRAAFRALVALDGLEGSGSAVKFSTLLREAKSGGSKDLYAEVEQSALNQQRV